ncbi:MAG: hypothetical protein CTY16_09510 [Methylobacter sp.]|nr:MAG: hypothetical protein CTY16_09510 [Methylobacter sp.]
MNHHAMMDLSNVEVVGASVDTVRQLYFGIPKPYLIESFQQEIEQKEQFFHLAMPNENDRSHTEPFHLAKMGKVARYRYKLQNNELGVVILFGSYYNLIENEGQHLKIELSPKFISCRTAKSIQDYMDTLASRLLMKYEAKGCSVHLACDYQNFTLPRNFLDHLSTYSRTIKAYDGVSQIDLSDISEAVTTYGSPKQERNYLIGKPDCVQMAIYDKSYEIVKSDKVDYFHNEWGTYSLGVYDPEKVVRRIEARIHHKVIREIGQGMGVQLESFEHVSEYLTNIWRYALKINRFNLIQGKDMLHPFWQLLMEDVHFYVPAQNFEVSRKKKQSVDPVAKNITSLVGNFISLCVRQGYDHDDVMIFLKAMPVWGRIRQYYKERGLNETDIRENIKKSMLMRRLLSRQAA